MTNKDGVCTWDMVAQRLASIAKLTVLGRKKPPANRPNYAMITVTVFIDNNGNPVGWTKPSGERLEPSGNWVTGMPFCQPIDE